MTDSDHPASSTPQPTALCELGVLGVETGGQWAAVRGPLASILLAALGLAGHRGVRTEELLEIIWPSPDRPSTARQSLANIVLRLRTLNGESFIESTQHGYRLGDRVQSDRERFLADVKSGGELGDATVWLK